MRNQTDTAVSRDSARRSWLSSFSGLRTRLLLLIVMVLLPILALLFYTASEQARLASISAQREALRVAELAASNQDQLVAGTEQLLQLLSQLEVMHNGDAAACNALFEKLHKQYPSYTNFWATDTSGGTYCTGIPSSQNLNVANSGWFKRAMQTKGFSVGDYGIGVATGKPLLTFAYPVFDSSGNITLFVATALDLTWFNDFIQSTQLPPETVMTAIDRNGVILFRYPDKQDWVGKVYPNPDLIQTVVTQGTGTITSTGIEGTERLFGFSPLGKTNGSAYVIVGTAKDAAFAEANRLLALNLIGLSTIGLLTLALAWYGTNLFVVRPVYALVDSSARLAAGDLRTRINPEQARGTSELSKLSYAFNEMAEALEQRQKELAESNVELANEIAERKRTGQELLTARNELEVRVQQRTAELGAANMHLQAEVAEREQAQQQLQQAANRALRLQEVTAALSSAITRTQVAEVYVMQGIAAMGAVAGAMGVLVDDQTLEVIYASGYDNETMERWSRFGVGIGIPMAETVRIGEPIWLDSRAVAMARFPNFSKSEGRLNAWAALPIVINGSIVGGSVFSFTEARNFSDDDKALILALARQCAQALERADLYDDSQQARAAAEKARQQLAFLADASSLLATSLDYETTFNNLARLVIPAFADTYTVDVLEDDGSLHRVAMAASEPGIENAVRELTERYPIDGASLSVRQVLNSGEPLFLPEITQERYEAMSSNEEHLKLLYMIGTRSSIVLPLRVRDQMRGILSLGLSRPDRRYTEEDLILARELAQRAAQAVDNARLYSQVKEAVQLRDEFLSVAAHELKTPVTSLRGFAQSLLRQLDRSEALDPQRVRRAMEVVDQQSVKLSSLLSQLLDISRLEAGRLTLDIQPTDIALLVRDVTAMLQRTTEHHTISIEQPDTAPAQVDPFRVEQVLVNLLDNAIKYSPDGGPIQVTLSLPPVSAAQTNPMMEIAITDRGMGIPPERRDQIFNRFYQAHGDGYLGGMGLGLYISRQIIELHGGQIRAEFPAEGGTRFVLQFPLRVSDMTAS